MASEKKRQDREIKTRKAEAKVKEAIKAKASPSSIPAAEKARQDREIKTRKAEGAVKQAVKKGAAARAEKAPKGKGATPKLSLGKRLGNFVRKGVGALKGKPGPVGILATGAAGAMAAGRYVDKKVAESSGEKIASRGSRAGKGNTPTSGKNESAKAPAKAPSKAPAKPSPKTATGSASSGAKPAKKDSPSSSTKTKGGDYPVYRKTSSKAKSFREAFAAARKDGKKVFEWEGRKYNTKLKGK